MIYYFLLPLLNRKTMSSRTSPTRIIPDHIPALNIPAIAEQPGNTIRTKNKQSMLAIGSKLFMVEILFCEMG
jgi:hypothetical protein